MTKRQVLLSGRRDFLRAGLLWTTALATGAFSVHGADEEASITSDASWRQVVERNWDLWSGGRDSVSKMDLVANVAKPQYQGEDAAALVALEKHLRKVGSIDRAGALAVDEKAILDTYQKNIAKLRGASRVLFAHGRPDFSRLQQGPGGDCYFFSGTGWMALNRPELIVKAIRPLSDGRYRVVFPNGDDAVVEAPTDAEMAFNDSASTLQDGLWMSVLEKATGVIQQQRLPAAAAVPDPTVSIDVAGLSPSTIVRRWSGRQTIGFRLKPEPDRTQVRRGLIRMQERGALAEALILHKPKARLMYNHVYAVLGFDSTADVLKIWNPHGQDFTPEGASGPEHGYETRHGVFFIPLHQFIEFFTFLTIESR